MIIFVSMKKMLLSLTLLLPLLSWGYGDHRGRNLDSLEQVLARYTPDRLAAASLEERTDYSQTCREMAWAYLQLDGVKCRYYARQAMKIGYEIGGRETVFDMAILTGQCFWAEERYDSARVYYAKASDALALIEQEWNSPDRRDLEADQARLWGTLGNFYAMQDSVQQFVHYYGMAGELFEKWGWWEDCSHLHCNIGEIYTDHGELKKAKPEYERALQFARQSGDSLIIAGAMYGLGRWYNESGRTGKALEYLAGAEEYYGDHPLEEAVGRADTLAVMNEAHRRLYQSARIVAVGAVLILLLAAAVLLSVRRLKRTERDLTETSAVLEETIEELRPVESEAREDIHLTRREKDVARLLMEGKTTQEIAWALEIGNETVLWYRKRLYAKLNVHSAAAFTSEMLKRGLLEEDGKSHPA